MPACFPAGPTGIPLKVSVPLVCLPQARARGQMRWPVRARELDAAWTLLLSGRPFLCLRDRR
jgi:hypothetical protein